MPSLIIRARLFSGEDTALAGRIASVQAFDLSSRKWQSIAEAQSDADGRLEGTVDLRRLSIGKLGPALRLIDGDQEKRVLSPGALLTVQGRTRDLLADFGEIEVLGEAAFPRLDTQGNEGGVVAGLARKKGMPQATIIRSFERNPDLGVILGRGDAVGGGRAVAGEVLLGASRDPRVVAEIETLHAINLDNSEKLATKDRLLATREHELTLKTTELQGALARAADAERKLAEAKVAARGEAAEIDAVVANIGTRIGAASTTLKGTDNPFRIGAVRLDLKGSLADDGRIFLGGDRADGSGFSIEMSPEGDKPTEAAVTVPDVTGLTQSAARRVLRSVGLRLSAASQTMAQGQATHGHSQRQTPAAGGSAAHGSEVLVVFANVNDPQE